ncbi:hypothetical protein A2697_05190 [Candidatus Curtissbacteria bacterium RIFCSPHIGHO2_01_FULL_41_44]|uniref:Uncharacterized protein n=1 Tax=Candidatus Curtissbacteria bacterium RIFCSPLOWO2_01_FULL_42_50 TaxID=1797730 RepID=A0A1F5H390_9BACT|nr:MAG: hypothetical protein A2697_05190 [Candidatus Curtissbacteria bacterium RIFCSPHIGHO2_01_FULL_41_44]OGD93120.1 MAG: hypothetical protein A3C33_04935 [Candidatus Curtissbacteria bacterium RIFCSPHIGHO2_02_FULL_42_58]OGD96782.1 MAG: hypothetical protein A3E71_01380 [Candidatus Curtissbacteria bacterium RIFCSPHIGHO2_12_FULL_42_33]OGD98642.1 MAG: hypothetical protein A3B54_02665 [Candidatus Curtissbacteria bacterium RIFCSPLOWO2_01_FULL_42_50]OGE02597.1 MAG: hypothetical protein A3G16_03685 [Ca
MLTNLSTVVLVVVILVSISATYNAYLLRGGKLAWSEILIVLGMVSFVFSVVLSKVFPQQQLMGVTLADLANVLGFVFLLFASLKMRFALR